MNDKMIKAKAFSGVFWKGMERICAQLVSTVVTIVLARLLVPEDYSVVSIIGIFFSFCNLFISAGLNTALIQKKDAVLMDYYTVLTASTLSAVFFYLLMFVSAPLIAALYNKPILISSIRVMGLTFFVNAYKSVVSAKVTSDLQFKKFFWSTLIGTAISAVIGIALAVHGAGPWALIAQQMVNSIIDSIILTITAHFRPKLKFSYLRFKGLFNFGGQIFLSSIIHTIYLQIRPLIIGIRYSATDLAYYNKGNAFPELITSLANNTLSSSLFPVMAKVQDNKAMILNITRRYMQLSSFLVFPLMLGFAGISECFVCAVLTEKWMPIVPYVIVFCFSSMLTPIQDGNLQAIRALGRGDIFLRLEILKKTSYFVVILLFVLFTRNPLLLAISNIVTSIVATLFNIQPNKKLIGYTLRLQVIDLLPNFLIALLMGLAIFGMKGLPFPPVLLMLIQIASGIVLYVGLSIVTKNKSYFYLINTIKGLINHAKT